MDLSNPLATITPTLDAGVLQVLATTTGGRTAGEVHRQLQRGSDSGIRRVLERLTLQGVVNADRTHRFPLYALNRHHVAAPYIEGLASLRQAVVASLRRELLGWAQPPLHAGIFGSFARGEAHEASDIDLLLVRPTGLVEGQDEEWLEAIGRLRAAVEGWTGNEAQILDVAPETLAAMARSRDPLVESWRRDEVHLTGVDLRALLGTSL